MIGEEKDATKKAVERSFLKFLNIMWENWQKGIDLLTFQAVRILLKNTSKWKLKLLNNYVP